MASGVTAAMESEDPTAHHPGFSNDKYSMLIVIGALYRPHILDYIVVEIERGIYFKCWISINYNNSVNPRCHSLIII